MAFRNGFVREDNMRKKWLLFLVLGMLLGVPVCSVVYSLVQAYIRTKPEAEENQ